VTDWGSSKTGFRVASIPEPNTRLLGLLAVVGLSLRSVLAVSVPEVCVGVC
jgi:hypothetical protein